MSGAVSDSNTNLVVRLEGIEPPALRSGDPRSAVHRCPRRASVCQCVFAGRDSSPCHAAARWGIGRNPLSRCDPWPAVAITIFRRDGGSRVVLGPRKWTVVYVGPAGIRPWPAASSAFGFDSLRVDPAAQHTNRAATIDGTPLSVF